MTRVLQINNRVVTSQEIIPLLAGYQLLPKLLREIVVDQAIEQFSYSLEEREQAYKHFYQKLQFDSDAELQTWLNYYGITSDQLEALATRELKIQKLKLTSWGNKLQSYFLQRKSQLDKVIYSLLRTKDIGIAQEVYFCIQEGERSFAECAKEFSEGPEAETGGQVGPVALGMLNPALVNLLSASQPGQLLHPVQLEEWFVIVRLEKLIPAQFDDAMRQRLLNEMFEMWIQNQMKQLDAVRTPATPVAV